MGDDRELASHTEAEDVVGQPGGELEQWELDEEGRAIVVAGDSVVLEAIVEDRIPHALGPQPELDVVPGLG